jgi:uncharacterized membrane protein YukC
VGGKGTNFFTTVESNRLDSTRGRRPWSLRLTMCNTICRNDSKEAEEEEEEEEEDEEEEEEDGREKKERSA